MRWIHLCLWCCSEALTFRILLRFSAICLLGWLWWCPHISCSDDKIQLDSHFRSRTLMKHFKAPYTTNLWFLKNFISSNPTWKGNYRQKDPEIFYQLSPESLCKDQGLSSASRKPSRSLLTLNGRSHINAIESHAWWRNQFHILALFW